MKNFKIFTIVLTILLIMTCFFLHGVDYSYSQNELYGETVLGISATVNLINILNCFIISLAKLKHSLILILLNVLIFCVLMNYAHMELN